MPACTFFGHHDCPSSIKSKLREVLINLIENHAIDMFYVGQQGAFDDIVRSVLKDLVPIYPHIRYAVVLERLPQNEPSLIPATTPIPCSRRALKISTHASPSHGETNGCSSNPTMSWPTSPTPGAAQPSLPR